MSSNEAGRRLGVGIVGCGAIADSWFAGLRRADSVFPVCCAARTIESARRAGRAWGLAAVDVPTLLAMPDVEIVLVLTPPASHAGLARQALAAGKHVYLEKPVTGTAAEARALDALAEDSGLRIGCAPDTFLGAAHQIARRLIDEGRIGTVTGASLALSDGGPNRWLAAPEALFASDMGPVRDMAPYYLTHLVCLLGACRAVEASAMRGPPIRSIMTGPRAGQRFLVQTPTSWSGTLTMSSGLAVTFNISWDATGASRKGMTVEGTSGRLDLPNPNWFGGDVVQTCRSGNAIPISSDDRRYGAPNHRSANDRMVADYRGAGLDDMAAAILSGQPHRTNLSLAAHVLDIVEAIILSGTTGRTIPVTSDFTRPAPLD